MAKGIKISDKVWKKVTDEAKKERRSKKAVMDIAVEDYLKKKGKK